jgi:radical SAM superfamily enzyme YgiQ (UPF0313 family)
MLSQWLCDLTYTQQTIAADVFPAAIGSIAEYIESIEMGYSSHLFKYPEKLAEAIDSYGLPDVVSFSYYVWNSNLSEKFAAKIKDSCPKTIIVFGGPSYPVDMDEREAFLRERPFIDYFIRHEGEVSMLKLIQRLSGRIVDLSGVDYIDADGEFVATSGTPKQKDLSEFPSPYLSGRLDEFFDGKLTPILQTNRGCPFTCTFCVEGTDFYSSVSYFPRQRIDDELLYIAKKMAEHRNTYSRNDLFIADSNFGMYPSDLNTCRTIQRCREEYKWPDYINVATGKNAKKRVLEAAKIIKGALRLSGSVQSLDGKVLKNIKRSNIDVKQLYELGLEAGETGANTYSEVILGLPGDSMKGHLSTLRTVIDAGFNQIQPFQLMILPGTPMCTNESRKRFGLLTRYRVLPRCYGEYEILGQKLQCAEIEEVCVGCDDLTFIDYINCRKFHLTIAAFYNDGVFSSFIKILKALDLSVFSWLTRVNALVEDSGLQAIYRSFLEATETELWPSVASLREFCSSSETIHKFIDGELGNNLIFVHRGRLLFFEIKNMSDVALSALISELTASGLRPSAIQLELLSELADYQAIKGCDILSGPAIIASARYQFQVELFNDKVESFKDPESIRRPIPVSLEMEQSGPQRETLCRMKSTYGDSPVAIGRILTKIHVKRLFREAKSVTKGPLGTTSTQSDLVAQGISE